MDPAGLLVRCEVSDGGVDPCSVNGLICNDGICEKCKPEAELCDGRDNDCDGKIDEGFDSDGDGFTWCGGGRQDQIDCDPNDAAIHPPAPGPDGKLVTPPELCDGKDNDCDGKIDEDASCESLHSCQQDGCQAPLSCDDKTNQCIAPREPGSVCQTDAECGSGFCTDASALGLGDVLKGSLCGTACCSDADCPQSSVCVQSGTGARVCLPLEIAGRQLGDQGSSCRASSDCVSGVCQSGRCIATCSRNSDCEGSTCRLNVLASSLLSGAGAWICGAVGGRGAPGDLCTSFDPTSCQSALCFGSLCAGPCGSDADCTGGLVCRYVAVKGLLGGGRVTACVDASALQGTTPAATCCTSADCKSGQMCRPMESGTDWGMYCEGVPPSVQ